MNSSPGSSTTAPQKFSAASLQHFARSLLIASGLADDRANDIAEVLVEGDLLGHSTHGLTLLPSYLASLESGSMAKHGEPLVLFDAGSAVTWDGAYLPGPWVIRKAIAVAQERLASQPLITVVIRRSHHIGCLQSYLRPVTESGYMILLTCSDPQSRTVAPHGGLAPRYSPNPIAAGIPTPGDPILIDISTSATSNGLCMKRAAAGERLPGRWLIDREGNPTDDPKVLYEGNGGSILPLGGTDLGYKGFALGILVEALTGALAGHGRADGTTHWGASVFLQIINPDRFGGRDAFVRETGFLAQSCRDVPAASGKPRVRLPGEAALARRAMQLANGVELDPPILPALKPWAEKLKVKLPQNLRG